MKGKVAIVTGAGSGIGKALARRLAQDGCAVVVADIRNYDTAAAEIAKATGARTLGLQVDVAAERDVERMAAETVKAFGRMDILAIVDRRISMALSFIRENACRKLKVEEVTRRVGIARHDLERGFRKYVGRSPQEDKHRVAVCAFLDHGFAPAEVIEARSFDQIL